MVDDTFYVGLEYHLLDLVCSDEPPLRPHPLDAPMRLAANTMPEPDLAVAERYEGPIPRRHDERDDGRGRHGRKIMGAG